MSNLQIRLLKMFLLERLKVIGITLLFFAALSAVLSLFPIFNFLRNWILPDFSIYYSDNFRPTIEGNIILMIGIIVSIFLKCISQFQLSTLAGLTRKQIIVNELLIISVYVLISVFVLNFIKIDWIWGLVRISFSSMFPPFREFPLSAMILKLFADYLGWTILFFIVNKFTSKKMIIILFFLIYPFAGTFFLISILIPNFYVIVFTLLYVYFQFPILGTSIVCGLMLIIYFLVVYKHQSKITVSVI